MTLQEQRNKLKGEKQLTKKHEHELEYCQSPQDFTKRYGRWQVRCVECEYKSYLIADQPPIKLKGDK